MEPRNPSTSSSPVPNSCKTARIPKPSHPHPGFSQRTLHVQVAQTFALSIDAEEVLHQILLRHLKLSMRMGSRNGFCSLNCWDSEVNPGGFFGGVDWLMIFHRKVTRPNLILCWGFWLYIYIYTLHTILNSILISYQFSLSLLFSKSISQKQWKKKWPHCPIFLNSLPPNPFFLLQKSFPHLVVHLLFSTWC